MTIRLYHEDAYLCAFESVVTAARGGPDGDRQVALAATAFYPAAGGQPPDAGTLAGYAVTDVLEEHAEIWHRLGPPEGTAAPPAAPAVGDRVAGAIDWDRRFDHMQQHTGQHILSQACLRVLAASTTSVHMGNNCTLDLAIPEVTEAQVAQVERVANIVVMEGRAVHIRQVDADEAASLGLRRPPGARDRIRVVEVEGFDRSACGGTHVRTAAEAGPIAVRAWERSKGGVRVEFLCGRRVLRDYRATRGLVRDLMSHLTTGEDDVAAAVVRLQDRVRQLGREVEAARRERLDREAADLVREAAPLPGGLALVTAVFGTRLADDLRALARAIAALRPGIAVLAVDGERRLLVTRSPGVGLDAAAVLREALAAFGGRGGGKPEMAEGTAAAAPSAASLADAAQDAVRRALAALDRGS